MPEEVAVVDGPSIPDEDEQLEPTDTLRPAKLRVKQRYSCSSVTIKIVVSKEWRGNTYRLSKNGVFLKTGLGTAIIEAFY